MDKLRSVSVHPAVLVAIGVVAAAWALWAVWLGPSRQEADAQAKWMTPEAAKARRGFPAMAPDMQAKVRQIIIDQQQKNAAQGLGATK